MIVVETTVSTPEVLFYSVYKSRKRLLSVHDGARFLFFFCFFASLARGGKKYRLITKAFKHSKKHAFKVMVSLNED